MIFKKI